MPWPSFTFPFATNNLFNSLSQLSHPIFQSHLGSNSLFNSITPPFQINQNFPLFPIGCSSPEIEKEKNQNIYPFSKYPFCQNRTDNYILSHFKNEKNQINQKDKQINQKNEKKDEQVKMVRFRRRRTSNKPKNLISHNSSLRNDTKNIPKNYGKAMLSYIQKNSRQVKSLLQKYDVDHVEFMIMVKSFKSKINTIHDLREMWGENQKDNSLKACIRILSYHFMRKKCLPYIFNSRIKNYRTHIKYRKKIMEGIQNPQNFTKIKQF